MTMRHRILFCTAMMAIWLSPAAAQDLKVLTGAGLAGPVRALAADFGVRNGMTVTVAIDTAGGVQKRMEAGEAFDLVIGTGAVIDTLTKENLVAAEHFEIARMVEGVAAKAGAAKPDLRDAAAVKQTLLAAKSIAYVDPATGAVSGAFLLSVAEKMGIADQVKAKAVLQKAGSAVPQAVADGEAELGVTLISEMVNSKGVTAWPLPGEIQMTTIYAAAVTKQAQNNAAKTLLEELRGPRGRETIATFGLVPVGQ
jgi:molybdate transport system substrate-binding protein